jgi:hypothetical protein
MGTRLRQYLEQRDEQANDLATAIAEIIEFNREFCDAADANDDARGEEAWQKRKKAALELLEMFEEIAGVTITVEEKRDG